MYCNYVIPLTYEGKDVDLVVTAVEYTPVQVGTHHREYLPEGIEIQSGYVVDSEGSSVDFYDVLDSNMVGISDKVLKLYKEERGN